MATAHDHGEPSSHSPTPYVRLHVTPLDHELLQVVLPSTLLPKARNVSYHTIETFPEKRYGFLELPSEDAEKLRKKLNGSILKGVKIRIERARPSGIPAPLGQAAMAKEKTAKKAADGISALKDKSKKRKRGAEELGGIVLGDGRKVKRGWTSAEEPKEKRSKKNKEKKRKEGKKQAKSKYTDHAECLVKTMLPANAILTTDAGHSPPAKKKSKAREVVVHEFERTTKFPTFLKAR
ncbi:031e0542-b29b-4ad7-a37d-ef889b48d3c7 [Thermothielavioides terrestris]|uniref:031e0542-b29b-4ad7-a37d-ef889b48d3c7 n=1 Tax=Thermothielavioides terrestris TaxID=2587410 RepID=A0A3S4CBR0_9PEZI|nr:031e0542-b29b-4ad7-a37d-ef889b48d3c7 [Thermothielavioides terrestris]